MNIKAIKAQQSIRKLDFNSCIDYQFSCESQVVNDKNSKIQTQSTFRPKSSQDLNNFKNELKNNHISDLLSRKALLTVDYQNFDKVTFQPFLLGLSNYENLSKFQQKETKKVIGQRPSVIPVRLFSTLGVRRGSSAAKIRSDSRSPQTKKASDFKLKQSYPNIFPSRQSIQITLLKQSRSLGPEKKSFQFQRNPASQIQQGQLKQQTFRNFMNEAVKKRRIRPPSSFYNKRSLSARGPEVTDLQQMIEVIKIRIN